MPRRNKSKRYENINPQDRLSNSLLYNTYYIATGTNLASSSPLKDDGGKGKPSQSDNEDRLP